MPKFLHLRSAAGRGAVTIAFDADPTTNIVYYAIARCNPKDNFCRHTGRVKSAGRLKSPKWVKEFKYEKYEDIKAHFLTYAPDYVETPELKDRVYNRPAHQVVDEVYMGGHVY